MSGPPEPVDTFGNAWFACRLADLAKFADTDVVGILSMAHANAGFSTQLSDATIAWRDELQFLRRSLNALMVAQPGCAAWFIALEYEIPRREKRIDAVLLSPHAVTVMEFKNGASTYARADLWQVQDYALDLRDFHAESLGAHIEAILVSTNAQPLEAGSARDTSGVWRANADSLTGILGSITGTGRTTGKPIDPRTWLRSGYRPTPTIVETARRVFAGHNVRELSHAYADNLTRTTEVIADVIRQAKSSKSRVICFVTGVPGSGKTLAGLTAMQDARALELGDGASAFMSGNGPLVRVLRAALVRDQQKQGRKVDEATRETELLLQNVHRFIEEYAFRRPNGAPPEHVIAFDEAQRAWHAKKLSKRHKGIGRSEPDLILDVMGRPSEWSVVIALVGGGQEIHDGEAGLGEWGKAVKRSSTPWQVVVSPEALYGGASVAGHQLFGTSGGPVGNLQVEPSLHLSVSVRSPRAQRIAEWVNAVISLNAESARNALKGVEGFRLLLTRSLSGMRRFLAYTATGTLRAGLLATSGALRLRAYGLEIDPDFHREYPIQHWFLGERDDFRSSDSLEVAMTEFESQGLELDYVGLCWGDDLTVEASAGDWVYKQLRGKKWRNIPDPTKRSFLLNKYRVLMTRAREGLVIWVPPGDPMDATRPVEPLDRTAEFLRRAGAMDLDAAL